MFDEHVIRPFSGCGGCDGRDVDGVEVAKGTEKEAEEEGESMEESSDFGRGEVLEGRDFD